MSRLGLWQKLLCSIVFAFAVVNLFVCIIGSILNFTSTPIFDYWSSIIFYARIFDADYSAWWEHHNEHRIILSRLLFWVDLAIFNGSGKFLIITNYVLLVATCFCFYHYLVERLQNASDHLARWSLSLFCCTLLFSWVQYENIIWSFQSQFFLASLLPLSAFYCLHKAIFHNNSQYFYYACLLGLLALGSMANGILTLPLLGFMGLLLGMSFRRIGLLFLLATIGGGLTVYGFQAPATRDSLLQTIVRYPLELLQYQLNYLGAPLYLLSGGQYYWLAVMAGAALLIVFSIVVVREIRKPVTERDSLVVALIIFIFFVCATALGTGGGRVTFGVTQALTSRYTTPVLQAWVALIILGAPVFAKQMRRYTIRSLVFIACMQALVLIPQTRAIADHTGELMRYRVAMLAAMLQVKDRQQIQAVFAAPEPLFLLADNPVINRLAFFNSPELQEISRWKGLVDSEQVNDKCLASIDFVEVIEEDQNHLRISGWIFNPVNKMTPSSVRILNAERQVVGFALLGLLRVDVKSLVDKAAGYSGFKGYIPASYAGKSIILKGVMAGCESKLMLQYPQNQIRADVEKANKSKVQMIKADNCAPGFDYFRIDSRGVFFDPKTHLQWLFCPNGQAGKNCTPKNGKEYTYQEALVYAQDYNKRTYAEGKVFWRLPALSELNTLENLKCLMNGEELVSMTPVSRFWARTQANYYGYYAWDVLFLQSYERWIAEFYHRRVILVGDN